MAIDRRVDERVVHEQDLLLRLLVPTAGVVLKRGVVVGVRPVGGEERGLVVGAPAHPAVRHPLPRGDRIAAGDEVGCGHRRLEERMRVAAVARVRFGGEHVLVGRIVQGVVEPRDAANAVAEGGMRRHVVDALAVDPDLAPVPQALEVLRRVHWAGSRIDLPCVSCTCRHHDLQTVVFDALAALSPARARIARRPGASRVERDGDGNPDLRARRRAQRRRLLRAPGERVQALGHRRRQLGVPGCRGPLPPVRLPLLPVVAARRDRPCPEGARGCDRPLLRRPVPRRAWLGVQRRRVRRSREQLLVPERGIRGDRPGVSRSPHASGPLGHGAGHDRQQRVRRHPADAERRLRRVRDARRRSLSGGAAGRDRRPQHAHLRQRQQRRLQGRLQPATRRRTRRRA